MSRVFVFFFSLRLSLYHCYQDKAVCLICVFSSCYHKKASPATWRARSDVLSPSLRAQRVRAAPRGCSSARSRSRTRSRPRPFHLFLAHRKGAVTCRPLSVPDTYDAPRERARPALTAAAPSLKRACSSDGYPTPGLRYALSSHLRPLCARPPSEWLAAAKL